MSSDLRHMSAAELYELARLVEQREAARNPWRSLSPAAVDEGLRLLEDKDRPALGWWRRNLPARETTPDWPPMPPHQRREKWEPWELVAAAVDMSEDQVAEDVALDVLASLAAAHQLDHLTLADAYTAFGDER